MNKIITLSIGTLLSMSSLAQNDVAFDASENWVAFMNVFDLPSNGGAYQFGSAWALADVKSTLDVPANTLTLQPNFNTYADNPTDPYWVDQTTGDGNKICEASTFVEPTGLNGSDLTFHGDVLSFDIDTTMYEAFFFIKALDSTNGFSDALNGSKVMPLPTSGAFTVSATAAEIPSGLLIQYGFIITGVNANPADETTLGSVVIGIDDAGIDQLNTINAKVYPNPVANQLYIASDFAVNEYTISNLSGQVVLTGDIDVIDVSSLESGTYIVHISTDQGVATKRFVKQ